MEIGAEGLERGPIHGLLLSPPPLAASKLGFGLVKVRQRLLPLSLEAAGDEPVLRVDGAIAAFGLSCCVAMALDVATLSAGADLAHYDTTKPADLSNWKTDARAYYDVNMPSGYMALNLPNANFSATVTGAPATGQTIRLSAAGSMPLLAPVIFGKTATDTGSGSNGGNLVWDKAKVKQLVEQLKNDEKVTVKGN